MRSAFPLALVVALATPACQSVSSRAQEDFAKKYTCPDDRIAVKARPDLDPTQAFVGDASSGTPSDEVKNDPARYAMWKAARDAQQEQDRSTYSKYDMLEVTGCGHTQVYGCYHRIGGQSRTLCYEATSDK